MSETFQVQKACQDFKDLRQVHRILQQFRQNRVLAHFSQGEAQKDIFEPLHFLFSKSTKQKVTRSPRKIIVQT
jgi:hypothetical protein